MSLKVNSSDGNPPIVQPSCCSIVGDTLQARCLRISCIFLSYICFCECGDSPSDEISLQERMNPLREVDLRYARKDLTASEKLKKQMRYALADPSQWKRCEIKPFEIPGLKIKSGPLFFTPFSSGVAQHQGSRGYQEDGYMQPSKVKFIWKGEEVEALLSGVFDGHEDRGNVSRHLNQYLIPMLGKLLTEAQNEHEEIDDEVICNAFTRAFNDLSMSYQKNLKNDNGAVGTCMFVINNTIYIPNIGDSRTILIKKNGSTYQITENASAANPRFQKWHFKRDHQVLFRGGGWRIDGVSAFARDIGSPSMCFRPKITKVIIGNGADDLKEGIIYCGKGDFFLQGSDGVFDAGVPKEMGAVVRLLVQKGYSLEEIANSIATQAGRSPGSDNVTVQIIAV
jgi:serine/threonine protein phosphatase PrpC